MTAYDNVYQQPVGSPVSRSMSTAPRLPAEDWVRDGGAALLLLLSLALPWTGALDIEYFGLFGVEEYSVAAGRVDVLLVTLLVVFGSALTFLMRGGVFGSLSLGSLLLIRLAVVTPYLLMVLVYVVLDATGVVAGLGTAVAAGLAGVALIAQPRRSEVERDPSLAPRLAAAWRYALVAVSGLVILTAVIALVFLAIWLAEYGGFGSVVGGLLLVLGLLVSAAIPLVAFVAVLRGSEPARIIAAVSTTAVLPMLFISALAGDAIVQAVESLQFLGYGTLWLAFAGGLLWSPALAVSTRPVEPLQKWFLVASHALIVIAVSCGLFLLQLLVGVIAAQGAGLGFTIPMIVLAAAGILVSLLARTRLLADPGGSRGVVVGMAAAAVVIGSIQFVMAIVATVTGSSAATVPAILVLIGVIAPAALVIGALTAPTVVRRYVAQFAPTTSSYPVPGTPSAGAPAAHPAANPTAAPEELAAWASDPQAWIHLAGNPATYPALLEWLAQVGDDRVQQVLRARRR